MLAQSFNILAFLFTWIWYLACGLYTQGLIMARACLMLYLGIGLPVTVMVARLFFGAPSGLSGDLVTAILHGSRLPLLLGVLSAWLPVAIFAGRYGNADRYVVLCEKKRIIEEMSDSR
jgi:hypothetical protein